MIHFAQFYIGRNSSPAKLCCNGSPLAPSLDRVWRGDGKEYKGIVKQLAEEGRIDHYRKLYCTRHTFITMALDKGLTPKEVASLVCNTAEVIMKHYAGLIRPVVVPEI